MENGNFGRFGDVFGQEYCQQDDALQGDMHLVACFLMCAVMIPTQFGRLSQTPPAGSHLLDLEA